MIRFLILFILTISFTFSFSQRNCGTVVYDSILNGNLLHKKARVAFETELNKALEQNDKARTSINDSLVTIPVVVHIVYNVNKPEQNISDDQIFSQIVVLNEDYRRKQGTYGFSTSGADTKIEFCLANQDYLGNYSTGITRHPTTTDGFDIYVDDEKLKAYGYWPSDQFLNIWIANLSGFLGYTQFPDNTGLEGLEVTYNTALTDGVAVGYKYFGKNIGSAILPKFSLGRTATHEVGHWLGLKHTWGDDIDCSGSDYCDDTPLCSGTHYASYKNCVSPYQCGTLPRQIENYLDYSDDPCMNTFTIDQKARMRTVLEVSPRRKALKNSIGCKGKTIIVRDSVKVDFYPNPSDGNITFSSLKPILCNIYNLNGVKIYNITVSAGINSVYFPLASGIYIMEINDKRKKLIIK